MYALRRDFHTQPVMPTGANPLPDLVEFTVTEFTPDLHISFGHYIVDIDLAHEVGRFQHICNGLCGDFWLAGRTLVAANHILPAEVRLALREASIGVA